MKPGTIDTHTLDDASITKHTGRSRDAWFTDLDAVGGLEFGRRNLVKHLYDQRKLDEWWATSLVVEYERARGDKEKIAGASKEDTARVWNAESGELRLSLRGHKNHVTSVVYSADGTLIATGSADDTARLWNAKDGAALGVLRGHTASVRAGVSAESPG